MILPIIRTSFFRQEDGTIFRKLKVIGQCFDSYIISKFKDDLFIIDQHAAHERVRYERLKERYSSSRYLEAQLLLSPVRVNLKNSREKKKIIDNMNLLQKFGIKGNFEEEDVFIVKTIPTFGYRRILPSFIKNIKHILLNIEDQWRFEEHFLRLIACHSAIRGKIRLRPREINRLLVQLSTLSNPWFCPHGRPIIKKLFVKDAMEMLSKEILDKEFLHI